LDEAQREQAIYNLGTILEINSSDNERLLNLYLTRAIDLVKNECNIKILPVDSFSLIEDISIFLYRNKGIENIKSEGKGSLSEAFHESLPKDYISRMNKFKRLRFL